MKLLKISENCGHYRDEKGSYIPIDKIGKEGLLQLVNWSLHEKDVSFDAYDEKTIKNQAHQIIYKSIVRKLSELRHRRQEFLDDSSSLVLAEYETHRADRGT